MTPKEKAEELIDKFRNEITSFLGDNMKKINAKKCALVAVDEILQIFNNEWTKLDFWTEEINGTINFWQEVKQEIQNL
jgi:hypothetical protein